MPNNISNKYLKLLYEQAKFDELYAILGYSINDLISDFKNKVIGKELCAKYGMKSYATIWKLMKCFGIKSDRYGVNQHQLSNEQLNKLNDCDWLRSNYETRSGIELAEELGVDNSTIYNYLDKHNIERRTARDGLVAYQHKTRPGLTKLTQPWLFNEYIIKRRTAEDIAKELQLSQPTILNYLHEHKLIVRITGVHQIKATNVDSTLAILSDKTQLSAIYENKSTIDIATDLQCTSRLVQLYLKRHGIKPRHALDYEHVRKPSMPQKQFAAYLDTHAIKHESGWIYNGNYNNKERIFELDEYLPDLKCFVEVQGEHWHGLERRHWQYQRVRMKLWTDLIKWQCLHRDYPDHRIVYLSEHEIDNWQSKLFGKKSSCNYDYSQLVFRINDNDALLLINSNHYLGNIRSGTVYSAHDKNEPLAACIVSPTVRQNIYLSNGKTPGEISRMYATKSEAKNLLSYLLSRVIKTEKQQNRYGGLVSFADPSPVRKGEHSGTTYKAANFKLIGMTQPSYFYINNNLDIIHKKTVYNRAKKLNLTEKQYTTNEQLHKLPEWPKYKYEFIF